MTAKNYGMLTTEDALKALVDKLMAEEKPVGFDVETGYHGPNRKKGSLFVDWDQQFVAGFSITNSPDFARYVPVAHDFGPILPNAWEIVKPALEELPVIAHHLKFEKENLLALDRKGQGPVIHLNGFGDSMIQSYVVGKFPEHNLKALTKYVFGHEQAQIESLFEGVAKKDLDALRYNILNTTPEVVAYACEDAAWCLALWEYFSKIIEANPKHQFIYDLEMRTVDVLVDMERAGHAVDWEAMKDALTYAEPFKEHMTKGARTGLGQMAGQDYSELNLGSAKQMREALYGQIGLTTTRTTKGGELSTDAIALERLSREHPAVKKVLEVREVGNLAGRLKKWVEDYSIAYDARAHPSFNQVVVASGRFSANDPSVQQLPKEWRWTSLVAGDLNVWDEKHWTAICDHPNTEFGKHYWNGNFRDFMIAGEGCYLLTFDYSQIELRALAGLSKEKSLLEAFLNDEDVHVLTTALMLGIAPEEVTDKQRQIGKTMNFALLYGMEAKSLGERLAISEEEAERLYEQYFSAFESVTVWMSEQKALGIDRGWAETKFGRKVPLWDLQADSYAQRSKGERLCVNAPVQGTAADIMKISMLRVKKALEEKGWWMSHVRMVNNIHDALVFDVDNSIDPNELREVLRPCVVWEIEGFPPLKVDWELGQKWGSVAKFKDDMTAVFDGKHWQVQKPAESPQEPEKVEVPEPAPEPVSEPVSDPVETPVQAELTVEMPRMPDRDEFGRFLDLLRSRPGATLITLVTPEGSVDLEKYRTDLTEADAGEVSRCLGEARVVKKQNFEIEELAEGFEL